MNHAELEQKLLDTGERLTRVEQILPTLLTRQEFETAMSTVKHRFDEVDRRFEQVDRRFDEVHDALAKHAEEIRHHFDVVSESLRFEIRIIAEGHEALAARVERVEQRVERLETPPPSPRRGSSPGSRKKSG